MTERASEGLATPQDKRVPARDMADALERMVHGKQLTDFSRRKRAAQEVRQKPALPTAKCSFHGLQKRRELAGLQQAAFGHRPTVERRP
ncbi:hypothetical protein ACHMW4_20320 [Mesorhizobium sp. UC22_110]|uniref:hypothetical protein n=1 Tax=unclassified Mesorhizobium TaxID=325217 RepID=UPI00366B2861